ncbi:MAG TPA: SLBB domain-containing protein, partial [Steroidobacteraceae bacterium]|nr:SLBB domain-containing protein [Steroidobacteraceae bacterium]
MSNLEARMTGGVRVGRHNALRRAGVCIVAAMCAALAGQTLLAQTSSGSGSGTDALGIFQGLSADQQQQILQRLGGSGVSGALGTSGNGTSNGQQQATTDQENARRTRRDEDREEQTEENGPQGPNAGPPLFKGQDSVVVEVDTHPLKPRQIDTFSAAAASSYSAQLQMQQAQQLAQAQLQAQQYQNLQAQQTAQGQALQQSQDETSQLSDMDKVRLDKLVTLIRSKNPYQLSREGVLTLPGLSGIPLAGLTEMQATLRLEVDPMLQGLHFRMTRLPLRKMGLEGLKPYGYDLFDHDPSTFSPVTNIPVPADYVLGAGDRLQVQLYGNQNRTFFLEVDRDGRVNFPELGPINVAGQRFSDVKDELEQRVARQMIGVKASVSMGDTRAIRVFVLGEAQVPGSYTISALGTMVSALYAAGGVKRIGSLRDIQLKREGSVIRHLDLYDLLIRGDTTDDAKLLPGDVVFIPPLGETASVEGEVKRPAIYEIRAGTTVSKLIELAGGMTPEAENGLGQLTRIDQQGERRVISVNAPASSAQALRNGDFLRVTRLIPTLDAGVRIQGYVFTPGAVAWRPGMRLTDALHSVDDLRPDADLHYVLIRREVPPDRHIEAVSADLAAALAQPASAANIPLMARDQITVFDLQSGRDRIIQPLLDDLRLQAGISQPSSVVRVDGRVKVPGEYPLEPGMRISDLIRAGGSLSDSAYGGLAELARYQIVDGQSRQTKIIDVDLTAVLRGDPGANLQLQPFDSLSVKEISLWGEQEQVVLEGQVRFPGTYAIKHGETLKSVLARAGGLTEYAFPEGSVFTRTELQQREQQQLDFLGQRMQTDIATMALQASAASQLNGQGGNPTASLAIGQTLLTQLKAAKAVGRLVIDLPRVISEPMGSEDDVVLRNGDTLIVPRYQQEVTVIGEVQSVTSHLYRADLTRADYI